MGNSPRYRPTELGLHVAAFFTKLNVRLFRTAAAAIAASDPVPSPLRRAFRQLSHAVDDLVTEASWPEQDEHMNLIVFET